MKYCIILALYFIFSFKVLSLKVICIDPSLDIVLSTNCFDLRIFKLSEDLCQSKEQLLDIDILKTSRAFFQNFDASLGFPLSELSRKQMNSFPAIKTFLSVYCPNELTALKSIKNTKSVYLALSDVSDLRGNENSKDGTEQYFDKGKTSKEYIFNKNPALTLNELNKSFHLFNDVSDLKIVAAKLFWRFTANVPKNKAQKEIDEARKNPLHIPNAWDSFLYLLMKFPIFGEKFEVKHEMLEICLKNNMDQNTYHFVIDRGAKTFPIFHSRVRVIYAGKGDGCELNSKRWSDAKAGLNHDKKPYLNVRKGAFGLNYSFNKVVKLSTDYLLRYPVYNGLYNCQHFATNIYNLIARHNLDFESWALMKAHSVFSPKEPKLDFINLD